MRPIPIVKRGQNGKRTRLGGDLNFGGGSLSKKKGGGGGDIRDGKVPSKN